MSKEATNSDNNSVSLPESVEFSVPSFRSNLQQIYNRFCMQRGSGESSVVCLEMSWESRWRKREQLRRFLPEPLQLSLSEPLQRSVNRSNRAPPD